MKLNASFRLKANFGTHKEIHKLILPHSQIFFIIIKIFI